MGLNNQMKWALNSMRKHGFNLHYYSATMDGNCERVGITIATCNLPPRGSPVMASGRVINVLLDE